MPVILFAVIFLLSVSGLHAEEDYFVLVACDGEGVRYVDYAKVLVRDDLDEFKRLEECGLPRDLMLDHVSAPFSAAKYNSVKILEHILDEWDVGVDDKDAFGESLFITALSASSFAVARVLAERGASTKSYDDYSASVLRNIFDVKHFWSGSEEKEWVRLLPYIDQSEKKQ